VKNLMRFGRFAASAAILLTLICSGSKAGGEPKVVMDFIAVLDLNCGELVEEQSCTILTNIIIDELVKNGKYTVIDRANRDKILSEQGFQQSGCAGDQCVVEMGQLLGVGKIVVGAIGHLGSTYLVNLQLINVQTGAVESSSSETCKCELDGLIQTVRVATVKLVGGSAGTASTSSANKPEAPKPTVAFADILPEAPKGKAVVVFCRKKGEQGFNIVFNVYIDDKMIGKLPGGSYFHYTVDAGKHSFRVTRGNGQAGDPAISVDIIDGGYYFFRGMLMPTGWGV
jgi:TolB-like protein